MIGLPSHVFAIAIEHDLFVFDSGQDRYLALCGAVGSGGTDEIDIGLHGALLVPDAAAVLRTAGLLKAETGRRHHEPLDKPTALPDASYASGGRVRFSDILRFGTAMAISAWTLRRGRSCRTFARFRRQRADTGPGNLSEALTRLRETRLIMPFPRRCLPASLIAARFLSMLGHQTEIVFGVRSHPFAAHCWVEADGRVLDDDLDRVRAFTPIAVGML